MKYLTLWCISLFSFLTYFYFFRTHLKIKKTFSINHFLEVVTLVIKKTYFLASQVYEN